MTDFELMYVSMAFLYLMECFLLTPEHSVLFTRVFMRWRLNRFPGCAFMGGKRLSLANPLPWAGEWHVAPLPGATITDRGILTVNSLCDYPQGLSLPRLLSFDSPEGKNWLQTFAAAGYPASSPADVSSTASGSGLAVWTDSGPARDRFRQLHGGVFVLKALCTLQFLWAFAGAPVLLRYFSIHTMVLPYLFVLFWLGGGIAAGFAFTHRRLHGHSWKAFGKALWLFCYPLAAMRAVQIVCAGVAPPCHESAVAEALMNRAKSDKGVRLKTAPPGQFHERGQDGEKSQGDAIGRHDEQDRYDEHSRPGESGRHDQGRVYLTEITAKLRYRVFSRSLSTEDSLALGRANERLLQAIYANWGVDSVSLLHGERREEQGELCHCPVCGIGLATVMEYCPHCLEVKTVACDGPTSRTA